jgi:hypothetical protein
MQTRSQSAAQNLKYAVNDTLSQVTTGVAEISSANSRVEEKVDGLMAYINLTQVGPLSSCLFILVTNITGSNNK